MLVQFRIENFMSFCEETVFSMVANPDDDAHPSHVIDIFDPEIKLLRAAAF